MNKVIRMLPFVAFFVLAGCGLLDSGNGTNNPQSDPFENFNSAATTSIAISGGPQNVTAAAHVYSFQPQTQNSGGSLLFAVENKPDWASFDASTGTLSGIPEISDIGTYLDIVISASNGQDSASLNPFDIDVLAGGTESILLSWNPPTTRANGEPLTNLAGYRFHYGQEQGSLSFTIDVDNPGIYMYEIGNLSPGRWYFVAAVYDQTGAESPLSNQAVVSIL